VDGSIHTIHLERGLTLRGVVINDATGRPLANVPIELRPTGVDMKYRGSVDGHTDSQGRFSIGGLERGPYGIRIRDTRPVGTTVRVDEQGRKSFSSPGNRNNLVDLSEVDHSEPYEIRVMTKDDPRLHPEG
jgi:hypothetical protein